MKKTTKIAALTAVGMVAAALTSQAAAGDLLVGIYDAGVGQTFVFDIGQFSALSQGETWNLDSLSGGELFGAPGTVGASGHVSGGAGFTSGTLAGAQFGVIGYAANGATFYYTDGEGATTADLSQQDGGTLKSAYNNVGTHQGVYQKNNSFQTDWATLTTTSTGSDVFDALGNYNVNGTQGSQLFLLTGAAFSGDATQDSYFTLGTDGVLQYGAAVPEPGTYGMVAGAGLLALSFRKQLRRKQA